MIRSYALLRAGAYRCSAWGAMHGRTRQPKDGATKSDPGGADRRRLLRVVRAGSRSGPRRIAHRREASNSLCALYPIDGGAAVPFEAVQAIFTESCTSCHAGQDGRSDGGAELSLDLTTAWASLVGQPAPASEACGGTLVEPGNPDSSYL